MVVLEDADLKKAAKGAVRACFSTAGHSASRLSESMSPRRCISRFTELLAEKTRKLRLGKRSWI